MKYNNLELENIIDNNKTNSNLYLSYKKLTDADMEIVASYALKNNTASIILSTHISVEESKRI